MPSWTSSELADYERRKRTIAEARIERLSAEHSKPAKGGTLVSVPQGEAKSLSRVVVSFRIHAVRPCDPDAWQLKELIDLLCHASILCGDSWDVLEIGSIRSEKARSKSEEKTVIEIFKPTKG